MLGEVAVNCGVIGGHHYLQQAKALTHLGALVAATTVAMETVAVSAIVVCVERSIRGQEDF